MVIVTTPRTGSTIVTGLLYNLASQWWGSKNNLREYFTLNPLYKEEFALVDGVIKQLSYERLAHRDYHVDMAEKSRRLEMLAADPNYTFKIFSSDFTPEIEYFIRNNYQVVYLERQDKIAQLLSFINLYDKNVSHYRSDANKITEIRYNRDNTVVFLSILKRYFDLKSRMPGRTLYYEDFMDRGSNEQALIELLDLPPQAYKPMQWGLVKTPYADDPKNIIVNEQEWLSHLPRIREKIQQLEQA